MLRVDINLVFTIINLLVFISFNEEIPFRSGCSRYGKEKSHDRRTVCKRGSC